MRTQLRHMLTVIGCLAAAMLVVTASAEDKPAGDDEIARWVKDLDSNKFSTRDQASNHLAEAGERAIDAVAAAALSDSREVSSRAIDILKRLMQSSAKTTKERAKAAVEKLAQGDNEAAARRAAQALKPPSPAIPAPLPLGQIQIGGGAIQVQGRVQIGAGGNRVIKVHNINGRKTIEVTDNGKKIEIVEDPQQGIDISITEKVNGQDKTEKYSAKDADELKKKHPEASKVYEQFKAGRIGGGIMIQVQANGVPGAAPNFVPPQFLPNPPAAPQQVAAPIAEARKRLAEAAAELKKSSADNPAAQKALEQVEAADRKLAEAEEKLVK